MYSAAGRVPRPRRVSAPCALTFSPLQPCSNSVICAPLVSPSTNVSRPFGGVFDLAGSERRLQEIEQAISQPGAWDKPEALTPLLQEKRRLEDEVERLGKLKTCCDDMNEWLALAAESEDPEALESLDQQRADLALSLIHI